MSEQREIVDASTGAIISMVDALERDIADNKELREEKKARLARIQDRGLANQRLDVELPSHLYGEWVPNDKLEIYRMQSLGFVIDDKYAVKRALHDQGDGRSVVGDAVFMVSSMEDHQLLEEIRRENYNTVNGSPNDPKSLQREEKEFASENRRIGMPIVEESRHRRARKTELEAALKRGQEQAAKPSVTVPATIIT